VPKVGIRVDGGRFRFSAEAFSLPISAQNVTCIIGSGTGLKAAVDKARGRDGIVWGSGVIGNVIGDVEDPRRPVREAVAS
jgi:hypothetical protein